MKQVIDELDKEITAVQARLERLRFIRGLSATVDDDNGQAAGFITAATKDSTAKAATNGKPHANLKTWEGARNVLLHTGPLELGDIVNEGIACKAFPASIKSATVYQAMKYHAKLFKCVGGKWSVK